MQNFLLGRASDNCTPEDEIFYRYTIIPDYAIDESDYIFGHGNEVVETLPIGLHRIILYATDDCKNTDSCSTYLYLKDCKPPTPYCYDGIATVLMASTGSVEIWAADFDAGSVDNCMDRDTVIITFDAAGQQGSRIFTCADIPDGRSAEIELDIYVHDAFGNYDFCTVTLLLQDGSGNACPDLGPAQVGTNTTMIKEVGNAQLKSMKKDPSSGFTGFRADDRNNEAILYQNRPNPYQAETVIGFELDQGSNVNLRIMDVTGKELLTTGGNYTKGYHEWRVYRDQLKFGSGVLYYQLETENIVLTKKMVIIE